MRMIAVLDDIQADSLRLNMIALQEAESKLIMARQAVLKKLTLLNIEIKDGFKYELTDQNTVIEVEL